MRNIDELLPYVEKADEPENPHYFFVCFTYGNRTVYESRKCHDIEDAITYISVMVADPDNPYTDAHVIAQSIFPFSCEDEEKLAIMDDHERGGLITWNR